MLNSNLKKKIKVGAYVKADVDAAGKEFKTFLRGVQEKFFFNRKGQPWYFF